MRYSPVLSTNWNTSTLLFCCLLYQTCLLVQPVTCAFWDTWKYNDEIDCSSRGEPHKIETNDNDDDVSEIRIHHMINKVDKIIMMEISYEGNGWIGFAFKDDRFAWMVDMVPTSGAVIGIPDDNSNNVGMYTLTAKNIAGVTRMDSSSESSSLLYRNIVQNETHTLLSFALQIDDVNRYDGDRNFIWAIGSSNTFENHKVCGKDKITLNMFCSEKRKDDENKTDRPSTQSPTTSPTKSPDDENKTDGPSTQLTETPDNANKTDMPTSAAKESFSKVKNKWKAHGFCMAVAWILLVPTAIGSSIFRKTLLPAEPSDAWFQVHRAVSILGLLFTVIGFFIAISAMNDNDDEAGGYKNNNVNDYMHHKKIGICIFIFAILQAIGGYFRPEPSISITNNDKDDKNDDNSLQDIDFEKSNFFVSKSKINLVNAESPVDDLSNQGSPFMVIAIDIKENDESSARDYIGAESQNSLQDFEMGRPDRRQYMTGKKNDTAKKENCDNNPIPVASSENAHSVWKVIHRVFGVSILVLAWTNCLTGVTLLNERYGIDNVQELCGSIGVVIGLALFLTGYQQIKTQRQR